MARNLKPNDGLNALADEHRRWLSAFDPQHLANWETRCRHDYEAAMTEASVRRMLQLHGVDVEPNEKLAGDCGGPDFRCSIGDLHFYVEVTCISIATAEKKTGIKTLNASDYEREDYEPVLVPFNITGMTEAIFNECIGKASQCADRDAPVLLAIGTFHATAAMTGFDKVLVNMALTGKIMMAWDINPGTGEQSEAYQVTELKRAAFLCPDPTQAIGYARCSISGLLLVNLGSLRTLGVLHPNPIQTFDRAALPGIEFGQVEVDRVSNQLKVSWANSPAA